MAQIVLLSPGLCPAACSQMMAFDPLLETIPDVKIEFPAKKRQSKEDSWMIFRRPRQNRGFSRM
jgi:hypothetical protein